MLIKYQQKLTPERILLLSCYIDIIYVIFYLMVLLILHRFIIILVDERFKSIFDVF